MINTIAISGNLAQDPEVRLGKNLNESYVTFSLCIHFYNGEEYVKCIAGGKTADYLIKNAKKGDHVGVTGKIRLNRWTNRNGEEVQELGISVSDADWSPKGAVANQQQSQQSQVPQNNYGGQSMQPALSDYQNSAATYQGACKGNQQRQNPHVPHDEHGKFVPAHFDYYETTR